MSSSRSGGSGVDFGRRKTEKSNEEWISWRWGIRGCIRISSLLGGLWYQEQEPSWIYHYALKKDRKPSYYIGVWHWRANSCYSNKADTAPLPNEHPVEGKLCNKNYFLPITWLWPWEILLPNFSGLVFSTTTDNTFHFHTNIVQLGHKVNTQMYFKHP